MKAEYKPLYEKFGLNVVYYRKRKKLTQLQLAELVDIDRSHISAIELGNVGVSFDVVLTSSRATCLISETEKCRDGFPAFFFPYLLAHAHILVR